MSRRLPVFGVTATAVVLACLAVFFAGVAADAADGSRTSLAILHQNDLHARLEGSTVDGQPIGGLARIAALVDEFRQRHPGAVLWLDGGDTWHGVPLANLFSGVPVVEALSAAGLDGMVLGNHDFNFGQDVLARHVEEAGFPILSANTVRSGDRTRLVSDAIIVSVAGLRVAVFGLTTPDTPFTTHPRNVRGLEFLDPAEVAAKLVPALRDEADLVIALTHLGFEVDVELAKRVPGIDVIVGGHSHTELPEAVQVGQTLIVQAGEHGKFLGVLELIVEDGRVVDYRSRLIPITGDLPANSGVEAVIGRWAEQVPALMEVEVGYTEVDLGGEERRVRVQETALANLIADSFRRAVKADIALVNAGSVRGAIAAGPIRLRDLQTVLPFGGVLVGMYLTGAELVDVLEHGVSAYPLLWGGFLQVSGLSYAFDPSRPAGERLVEVLVAGEPLDQERRYKVVTNDFMASGGDGYTMLIDAPRWPGSVQGDGIGVHDAVIAYLQQAGSVTPRVEGRIRIVPSQQ